MSPLLYKYEDFYVLFFTREYQYEPPHVHARTKDSKNQMKVLFDIENGKIINIRYLKVKGKEPFGPSQMKELIKLIEHYKLDIVKSWIDVHIYNKKVKTVVIKGKLK